MIELACDHGALELQAAIKAHMAQTGLACKDLGTYSKDSCDYPVFGKAAAEAVAVGRCDRGVIVCTTGIGISITANKVKGIRCALCSDSLSAEMTRRHNDANMLALGAGFTGPNLAERIVEVFLNTEFEGGRHARRVDMIKEMENKDHTDHR